MELWALYPELLIAGTALLLVPVAGWVRGRGSAIPMWTAMIALVVSMGLTARMLPWDSITIFQGTYAIDGFGNVFKLIIETGALVSLLICRSYFRNHPLIAHAPLTILFSTLGCIGISSAVDLGLIVLFLQMLSMPAYLLVGLRRDDPFANEATLKFFIYAAAALAIMAYGLTFLYGLTGSLNINTIGARLDSGSAGGWIAISLGLILVGYAFEMTVVPFHFWAPDVYQGTTAPAAGFLSVVPKVAGFAGLLRIFLSVFPEGLPGWPTLIAVLAALTMSLGNIAALRQKRMKRLLAYSSIAQAGYILMAVAVVSDTGGSLPAVGFYLAAYLFMNLGAFTVVAQVERATGRDGITAFQGLGRLSPWASIVLTLSLLSLAGIPPLAGFAGKVLLLSAAMDGGLLWLAVVAVINMAIGLFYYVAVVAQLHMRPPTIGVWPARGGGGHQVALVVCLAGTLMLGIFPELLLKITIFLLQMV